MLTKLFFSHFFCTEKPLLWLAYFLYYSNLNNKFFSIYNYLFRFFFLYSVFNEHLCKFSTCLVGPSGLEPPTSWLSGTRSNLLSYEPMWLVSDFCFTWTFGGDDGIRTHDPLLAGQVLSQLSYTPIWGLLLHHSFISAIGVDLSTPWLCQHWAIFPYSLP